MVKSLYILPFMTGLAIGLSPSSGFANFKYIPHAPVPVAGDDTSGSYSPSPDMQSQTLSTPAGNRSYTAQPQAAMQPMMPSSAAMQNNSFSGGEVINGFGSQVPLVTALREIVPASYQIAYANGVTLGTPVDWSGGKPWRDVLQTAVHPLGLILTEQNSVIYVSRNQSMMSTTRP